MIHRLCIKGTTVLQYSKKKKVLCASTDRHRNTLSIAPVTTSTTTEQAAAATHLSTASQHAYSQRVYESVFRVEGRAGSFPP